MPVRTPKQIIGDDALMQLIFEGYAVVPAEPTELMLTAFDIAYAESEADPRTTGGAIIDYRKSVLRHAIAAAQPN